ncbi:hypothetical protein [Constantimarinum furrinae]|uniref:Uncharacterized protein n=1 Tax=Constantimarinum furrinae TaxID=2562285 RepID=A0A7G8PS65_9FLAO|nr:hypothetical protein [Constantimarinum furrinae]QNJ97181.1 hypothetical protein ALE3EI_0603 [Constantimarinum furrinae]
MRKTITLFLFLISFYTVAATINCGTAYQDGTYGLQHAEKALEANNIKHLKEYALRSMEAQQRVFESTEQCGCSEANNSSYNAIEKLKKALAAEKFDMVRYYVKNALADTRSVLLALDLCTASVSYYAVGTSIDELSLQEQELLEQQQQLIEKQKKIEEQLKLQQELQMKIRAQKEEKFAAQKKLQIEAETNLTKLEESIRSIVIQMQCDPGYEFTTNNYHRTDKELEGESLHATYSFYSDQAQQMANQLITILSNCRKKDK